MVSSAYPKVFESFVKEKLSDFYKGVGKFYRERNKDGSSDSLTYFRNHYDRFQAMISLCFQNGITPNSLNRIAELGSFYPYVSYCFKLENSRIEIDLYDIILREHCEPGTKPYSVDGVRLIDHNLCTDEFPDTWYDLVFLSEVLEHLPTNLFVLEHAVMNLLNPGGHLLVTYPLHGKNARNYRANLEIDKTRLYEGHLREFTDNTVKLFFKDMVKVDETVGRFKAYGRIKLVLYRR